MTDPIARHARARPDALALQEGTRRWTYAALDRAVAGTQGGLRRAGVGPGDRVAVHMERSAALVRLIWGLWREGAVAVPLSTREPPATVVRQARRVEAAGLVTADGAVRAAAGEEGLSLIAPDRLEQEAPSTDQPLRRAVSADRPATILYTSGSTGPPKAALHTWANHLYSAKGANANMPLREGDRWTLSLPLYHVGGMAILVRCALAGAAVVVPEGNRSLQCTITAQDVTHVSLVATQLRRLMADTEGACPPSLRAVLLGGGPIPDALLRRGARRGWPLHTSYGCTEMASQVTTTAPGVSLAALHTAGRRLPHRRLRLHDGHILVAGAPLFAGYVTPDGLHDPRDENGWYPTGDRGHLDAAGRLHVTGRIDRMFVSGGENIQPEEIEGALERLPAVDRAVVVAVPSDEYGRRPVAFVQLALATTPDALRDALAQTLPGFKIPDAFHSLPPDALRGPLKIDRGRLREQARKLHDESPTRGNDRQ